MVKNGASELEEPVVGRKVGVERQEIEAKPAKRGRRDRGTTVDADGCAVASGCARTRRIAPAAAGAARLFASTSETAGSSSTNTTGNPSSASRRTCQAAWALQEPANRSSQPGTHQRHIVQVNAMGESRRPFELGLCRPRSPEPARLDRPLQGEKSTRGLRIEPRGMSLECGRKRDGNAAPHGPAVRPIGGLEVLDERSHALRDHPLAGSATEVAAARTAAPGYTRQ